MPYRLDIPGQVSEVQLKAIEMVASLVPEGGCVVEVGSLFGCSSWAWAQSVLPSVEVFCLDPWEHNQGIRPLEIRHNITYGLEQFKIYVADCPNIRPMKGYSPKDFKSWSRAVHLYYEDAVHAGPVLAENLAFWSSHVPANGVLCGDDFRPRFPDVVAGAHALAEQRKRPLIQVENFWCILPDASLSPGSDKVAKGLQQLAASVTEEKRKQGVILRVDLSTPIVTLPDSGTTTLQGRLWIESLDAWPEALPHSQQPLSLGVRITRAGSEEAVAETAAKLDTAILSPDVPRPFSLTLTTDKVSPGNYQALFYVAAGPNWTNSPVRQVAPKINTVVTAQPA